MEKSRFFRMSNMAGIQLNFRRAKKKSIYSELVSIGMIIVAMVLFWFALLGSLKIKYEWKQLGIIVVLIGILGCFSVTGLPDRFSAYELEKRIGIVFLLMGFLLKGIPYFRKGFAQFKKTLELTYSLNVGKKIQGITEEMYWIVAVITLVTVILLKILIQKKKGFLLLIITPLIPCFLMLGCNLFPTTNYWKISIVSMLMLSVCYYGGKVDEILKKEVAVICVVLILGSICGSLEGRLTRFKSNKNYYKIRTVIQKVEGTKLNLFGADGLMESGNYAIRGVGKGKLKGLSYNKPTKRKVWKISVAGDKPRHTLYMKAFIASQYDGETWKELDEKGKKEFRGLFPNSDDRKDLALIPYNKIMYALGTPFSKGSAEYAFHYRLGEYKDKCFAFQVKRLLEDEIPMLLPYGVSDISGEMNEELSLGNANNYIYDYEGFPNYIMEFMKKDTVQEFVYQDERVYDAELYTPGSKIQEKLDDYLKEHGLEKKWNDYTTFVKQHYLAYPKNNPNLLELIRQLKDREQASDYQGIDNEINNIFANGFSYSLYPGAPESNEDFIESFLRKKEGFCVHYATTAVMLYRAMGIPARYVEGYAIKAGAFRSSKPVNTLVYPIWDRPSDYKHAICYSTTITDESAHAWVEIFDENVGWIPREHTIGTSYQLSSSIIQVKKKSETETSTVSSLEHQTIQRETVKDQKKIIIPKWKTTKRDNKQKRSKAWYLAMMLATLSILFIVGIMIFYGIEKQKKKKRFSITDHNMGIRYMMQELILLGKISGVMDKNRTEKESIAEMKKAGLGLDENEWDWIYKIGLVAAFSNKEISVDEIGRMKTDLKQCKNDVLGNVTVIKRICFKIRYTM